MFVADRWPLPADPRSESPLKPNTSGPFAHLKSPGSVRDPAIFNAAPDARPSGCDLVHIWGGGSVWPVRHPVCSTLCLFGTTVKLSGTYRSATFLASGPGIDFFSASGRLKTACPDRLTAGFSLDPTKRVPARRFRPHPCTGLPAHHGYVRSPTVKSISLFSSVAALALVAGAAQAQAINSGQLLQGNVRAQLNAVVSTVRDDLSATAAAIGNGFVADVTTGPAINNIQLFNGDATSILNSIVADVNGDVGQISTAVANRSSIDSQSMEGRINNLQNANTGPTATLNTAIESVSGDMSATAAAISNAASINSRLSVVNSGQNNEAGVNASVDSFVRNVAGKTTITAGAIGNVVSVTGF
ncbi:hypothetical protein [Brevundimonas sp. R86498]|uniref:hypothetical protein n=1 Tax=Brevundimonas sp. R86498 TaxID=3093845 RepID=UPI0037C8CE6A